MGKSQDGNKRLPPQTPTKQDPARKTPRTDLSSAEMDDNIHHGGANGVHMKEALASDSPPPRWFSDFEQRQDQRFESMFKMCRDMFEGINLEVENMKKEVQAMKIQMDKYENKIDDLENRSRRNNLVIFNLPEKSEGPDCFAFVCDLIKNSGLNINPLHIQRVHRTGKLVLDAPKPRPVHIGFTFYQEKEACRKSLADHFKQHKVKNAKLFVSNDFSQRVQQMRKEKMDEVRKLRQEGRQAFLVYPAHIKIRDAQGLVRNP